MSSTRARAKCPRWGALPTPNSSSSPRGPVAVEASPIISAPTSRRRRRSILSCAATLMEGATQRQRLDAAGERPHQRAVPPTTKGGAGERRGSRDRGDQQQQQQQPDRHPSEGRRGGDGAAAAARGRGGQRRGAKRVSGRAAPHELDLLPPGGLAAQAQARSPASLSSGNATPELVGYQNIQLCLLTNRGCRRSRLRLRREAAGGGASSFVGAARPLPRWRPPAGRHVPGGRCRRRRLRSAPFTWMTIRFLLLLCGRRGVAAAAAFARCRPCGWRDGARGAVAHSSVESLSLGRSPP
ncbi:Protein of unknown function [Gryllus bimaculatus]|nr:Protein of unknown function [Gryllus bimaculatus]